MKLSHDVRRKYLVHVKTQGPYIFILAGEAFAASLVFLGGLYFINAKYLIAMKNMINNTANYSFTNVLNAPIIFIFLFAVLVIFLICFIASILVTHNIVGPVKRFSNKLVEVGEGKNTNGITFRTKDKLKDLASAFNTMVKLLEGRLHNDVILINEITDKLEILLKTLQNEKTTDMQVILKEITQIKDLTKQYKQGKK